ncbi:MAG: hypothetical protein LBO67_07275 [Spirochaetaceae bacterium]|nr:hypothetical protein [Spirochaetaceae bacterium]
MNRLYAKGKKRTKNHERQRKILDKEFEKIGNKKRGEKNKFIAKIGKRFKTRISLDGNRQR